MKKKIIIFGLGILLTASLISSNPNHVEAKGIIDGTSYTYKYKTDKKRPPKYYSGCKLIKITFKNGNYTGYYK